MDRVPTTRSVGGKKKAAATPSTTPHTLSEESSVAAAEAVAVKASQDAAARDAFWKEMDEAGPSTVWSVPMAHGASMPFLKVHERGMLVAMDRARLQNRTALLIDNSADHLVDTYYTYQSALVVEAKQLILDEATGRCTHEQILEALRTTLVNAMRYGQTLYIRMADSACDFNRFSAADSFPLALFDHRTIASLREYTGVGGKNLWSSTHPLAAVLRETDTVHGIFTLRGRSQVDDDDDDDDDDAECPAVGGGASKQESFELVVCSQLPSADALGMLEAALPLGLMQAVQPHPSSVRLKYSHYKLDFELEVGGTLPYASLDEKLALSFVFKGDFAVALLPDGGGDGGGALLLGKDRIFRGLRGGSSYVVQVTEDEAAEAAADVTRGARGSGRLTVSAAELGALSAKPLPGRAPRASSTVKDELAALSIEEIKGRSARYRALREASDLEDVLFGQG